jgi:hypothetical protein
VLGLARLFITYIGYFAKFVNRKGRQEVKILGNKGERTLGIVLPNRARGRIERCRYPHHNLKVEELVFLYESITFIDSATTSDFQTVFDYMCKEKQHKGKSVALLWKKSGVSEGRVAIWKNWIECFRSSKVLVDNISVPV